MLPLGSVQAQMAGVATWLRFPAFADIHLDPSGLGELATTALIGLALTQIVQVRHRNAGKTGKALVAIHLKHPPTEGSDHRTGCVIHDTIHIRQQANSAFVYFGSKPRSVRCLRRMCPLLRYWLTSFVTCCLV